MTAKKAVILLYPPSTLYIPEIRKCLTNYCHKNNCEIIQIIEADDEYDSQALQGFIRLVSDQKEPVTLIVDQENYLSIPYHLFVWHIFGTLLSAGLIDELYVYQGIDDDESVILKKGNLNYLDFSSYYFQRVMTAIALNYSLIC